MGNCDGAKWDMRIRRRGTIEDISFILRLREDLAGNLTGEVLDPITGNPIPGAAVISGRCMGGVIAEPGFSLMTLRLRLAPERANGISLTGLVNGEAPTANFGGTYRNLDEPGDTGTGGGSQTPLRSEPNQEKEQEYEG